MIKRRFRDTDTQTYVGNETREKLGKIIDGICRYIKDNLMLLENHICLVSSITILNIGCGLGYESLALQKTLNCHVIGIDKKVDENLASVQANIKLIKNDIYSVELNNKFEIIYCYHVLEHVNDPALLLQTVKNLLSKNGVAF